jgi:ADP-heptose:LPS heptosyltransferase
MPIEIRTLALGDSIHAFAVAKALAEQGDVRPFHVCDRYATIFADQGLEIVESPFTLWNPVPGELFAGPQHMSHIRNTMGRLCGVKNTPLNQPLVKSSSLAGKPNYVVICPDASKSYKEWTNANWSAVVDPIIELGYDIYNCPCPDRPNVFTPNGLVHKEVDLDGLTDLLAGAMCVIAVDSGPVHLADALGVPVIGLYGATSSATYGPYSNQKNCVDKHHRAWMPHLAYNTVGHLTKDAMTLIKPSDVLYQFNRLIYAAQAT